MSCQRCERKANEDIRLALLLLRGGLGGEWGVVVVVGEGSDSSEVQMRRCAKCSASEHLHYTPQHPGVLGLKSLRYRLKANLRAAKSPLSKSKRLVRPARFPPRAVSPLTPHRPPVKHIRGTLRSFHLGDKSISVLSDISRLNVLKTAASLSSLSSLSSFSFSKPATRPR